MSKFHISKRPYSDLWSVAEWMSNGWCGHWVEVHRGARVDCDAYVKKHEARA